MNKPTMIIIGILVVILGFLVIYSQQRGDLLAKSTQGQATGGGYGSAAAPAAGGYGSTPAPAAGGYGATPAAPAAGGYGTVPAAPAAGGYGAPAPAAGGYGK